MQNQLLLLEDVHGVGHKGEIIKVKPGFARNFLLPKQKAVIADRRTLKLQERLKKERAEQAAADRSESEAIAAALKDMALEVTVKVDHEGHMYGSVSAADIVELVKAEKEVAIERRNIRIGAPFKKLGEHVVPIELKEGVKCRITLTILGDRVIEEKKPEEAPKEEKKEEPEEES